ncbi:erythromycin esterase family protein [Planomicrobium sp. MB-3u-38]|uniref:erythromycin esterase family protein n=1 Tax=Planomicrobium sp. MB-3u-38 TaxID=2058318 RepID=UPI000C7E3645|nr:erythromycin esterase family protein [Planomicrobium sp. MB-3u-38]PKH10509.1 protein-L-isoaspartate O-methyltransferase [Planomicrobium sp. MB-3u-38]
MNLTLEEAISRFAQPVNGLDGLDPLMEAVGDAKIVLLGEATHGTSEYYRWRAEFSKRLIQEKGFSQIAVEGDWPSAYRVHRYINNFAEEDQSARNMLKQAFTRWPTWMWANEEIADFIDWLKVYNASENKKTGFYGIDVYSLWESMEEVIHYLNDVDPEGGDAELAKQAFSCFDPSNREPEKYAISYATFSESCIEEVTRLLASIRSNAENYTNDEEADLNLQVNSLVAKNAEAYYRAMLKSGADSWNVRDQHMVETVNELRKYHGTDARIIIWEHNTHIGDARATDMKEDNMVNVGQLLREQNPSADVFAVGFGSYEGTVIAAEAWEAPHEEMVLPPAAKNSWEELLHRTGAHDKLLLFDDSNRRLFDRWVGHRAVGVVYNPEHEAYGNYVPSMMSKRYDAFLFFDRTEALKPL